MDRDSYRVAETLGRQAIRSIHASAIHYPGAFDHARFPMRITNHEDLPSYIDVMHEGRFAAFMAEFDGLIEDEVEELVSALLRYCRFFLAHFNAATVPLPLSGMLSQYAIFRKLRGIPDARTILEIGPGSGLMSFFMAAASGIQRYDQIETAEPFYLLQNLIGRYLYGHRFVEHAQFDARAAQLGDLGMPRATAVRRGILGLDDTAWEIAAERSPRAEHFPWWKLSTLFDRRYDVVTSNANLTEFNPPALRYYSALTRAVLKPTGVFLAQCLGGGQTDQKVAVKTFMEAGFVPLALSPGFPDNGKTRPFALPNLVLLPAGHPATAGLKLDHEGGLFINTGDPLTRSIFSMDRRPGRRLAPEEIVAQVTERLRDER